jgi:hypothetical protein
LFYRYNSYEAALGRKLACAPRLTLQRRVFDWLRKGRHCRQACLADLAQRGAPVSGIAILVGRSGEGTNS